MKQKICVSFLLSLLPSIHNHFLYATVAKVPVSANSVSSFVGSCRSVTGIVEHCLMLSKSVEIKFWTGLRGLWHTLNAVRNCRKLHRALHSHSGQAVGSHPKGGENHAYYITYRRLHCNDYRKTQKPPLCKVTVSDLLD